MRLEQVLGRSCPTPVGVDGIVVDYAERADHLVESLTLKLPRDVNGHEFMIYDVWNNQFTLHRVQ